jgi:hypothetical protein
MQEYVSEVANPLKRIAEMSSRDLVSEEDVKNKVVLPILRALGYDDNDFNYERRTGRGYVDVVVDHYPTGIVVESKAPKTKLDNYRENYVFRKHGRDRVTLAILTDGDKFNIYGVTGALYSDSLDEHRILSFTRSDLVNTVLVPKLFNLLGKLSNQDGAISDAIAGYRKNRERVETIESELRALIEERERIDIRMQELEAERKAILGCSDLYRDKPKVVSVPSDIYTRKASPHILRLLKEREAFSKLRGVHRNWLDEQLINKVEGVHNNQAVSFGIIELRTRGKVAHNGGDGSNRPIAEVWLLETADKPVS